MENKKRILKILTDYCKKIDNTDELSPPAKQSEIDAFVSLCKDKGVPETAVKQLVELYQITRRISIDGFIFYPCDDLILFEWWEDYNALWLADRDFYIIRWVDGKFCLGSAAYDSYGDEYEFENLADLLEAAIKEWSGDDEEEL